MGVIKSCLTIAALFSFVFNLVVGDSAVRRRSLPGRKRYILEKLGWTAASLIGCCNIGSMDGPAMTGVSADGYLGAKCRVSIRHSVNRADLSRDLILIGAVSIRFGHAFKDRVRAVRPGQHVRFLAYIGLLMAVTGFLGSAVSPAVFRYNIFAAIGARQFAGYSAY